MKIIYPNNLPISHYRDSIITAIESHQVVVIAGDTGSGKTTQLPKMCLEALGENKLLIGCTQPRRIATTTIAAKLAEELAMLGNMVGYKIRFHDHTNQSTKIKFMTDGVLLAETRQDRLLSQYGLIMIDEAHERNLNIDFLLGYIKQLLPQRNDLKVIITSATIDTQTFSKHFDDAPIINVSGRTYPVTVHYKPPAEDDDEEKEGELDHCVKTVCELCNDNPRGDVLIFLPTERDIQECCTLLAKKISQAVILPMFGRLPAVDQKRIFQKFKRLKIVVATNIAETSITVPGIRYVIDSGRARISHYNVRAKTTSLPVKRISKASCDQRKGRCGRVAPGICIRLYAEDDYNNRPEYTVPELKRTNLAEVILQMISLRLGRPTEFPFIDPPHANAIRDGYHLLKELGAVNDKMGLTERGHMMADLPIDPCISRIILEAKENNCLREIKIISAALAIQDPRIRPINHEKEAKAAHMIFAHPHSDFMILLNIWQLFHGGHKGNRSWSKLKKYCETHFLSYQRMREWFDLHDQLDRIIARRKHFIDNLSDASVEQIHRALLAGFARNIARKRQSKLYQGAHNKELMVFPGSHQFMQSGQWILAASFISTNRLYALTVATIEPDWIESVVKHLCKYSWSNPRWHKKTGQVVSDETVYLFGLVIASGRKVNFAKRDKRNIAEARLIFIESALVLGELNGSYPFLDKNLSRIEKWQEMETKLRVRNIVTDESMLHEFYAQKIPADVYDQSTLNRFLKRKRNQSFLQMTNEDILKRKPNEDEMLHFPTTRTIGSIQIRLEYSFEPGSENDGITFRLPHSFASTVAPGIFEWLVPGFLHEKVTYLLKSLPKNVRKKLMPIANTVDYLLDDMDFGSGHLLTALENSILKRYKLLIQRSDWSNNLPLHLQPRFLLFDSVGNELCTGRDIYELLALRQGSKVPDIKPTLQKEDLALVKRWENTKHSSWNFSGLPAVVPIYTIHGERAGFLYATLSPEPAAGQVKITFENDRLIAEKLNRQGILYLYRLQFINQYRALRNMCATTFSGPSAIWLIDMGTSRGEVMEQLLDFILSTIFGPIPGDIIGATTFKQTVEKVRTRGLYAVGQKICQELMMILQKRRAVQDSIRTVFAKGAKKRLCLPDKEAQFHAHLNEIFPNDILSKSDIIRFQDIDRHLQSLSIRLERFYANPGKDEQKAKQLLPYLLNLQELAQRTGDISEEAMASVRRYRSMVDEYRISLFSPEIKTLQTVSSKKLDRLWQETLSMC